MKLRGCNLRQSTKIWLAISPVILVLCACHFYRENDTATGKAKGKAAAAKAPKKPVTPKGQAASPRAAAGKAQASKAAVKHGRQPTQSKSPGPDSTAKGRQVVRDKSADSPSLVPKAVAAKEAKPAKQLSKPQQAIFSSSESDVDIVVRPSPASSKRSPAKPRQQQKPKPKASPKVGASQRSRVTIHDSSDSTSIFTATVSDSTAEDSSTQKQRQPAKHAPAVDNSALLEALNLKKPPAKRGQPAKQSPTAPAAKAPKTANQQPGSSSSKQVTQPGTVPARKPIVRPTALQKAVMTSQR